MKDQSTGTTIGILKMGAPEPAFRARFGDFVDWITAKLPANAKSSVRVFDPAAGALPEAAGLSGLIITGSHSMVTDPSAGERTAFRWLERVLATELPVLGMCYGHQMLGHVLGGEVGPLPGGPEIGVAQVTFAATDDPLFASCGASESVAVIHWQSVRRLPAGAQVLAWGEREPHQAVRFQPRAWGVQFHPEFSPEILVDLVRTHEGVLREEGRDPARVVAEAARWRERTDLIRRFVRLAAPA